VEQQRLRLLVITAHPHDFTHTSATCGIHASLGDSVTLVSVTPGVYTHNEMLYDEMSKPPEEQDADTVNLTPEVHAAMKRDELRNVAALFGVSDVRFMDFPEPFRLNDYPPAKERLKDVILDVRPHVLITQSPYLSGHHRLMNTTRDDHAETALAVQEAQLMAATPRHGSNDRPHTIATTYHMGTYFEKDQFDLAVDISDWFEKRVEAESMFKSQGHTPEYARRRITVTVGNTGWFSGCTYAEAFVQSKPELLTRLSVSERAMRRATEPRLKYMRRLGGELNEDA